MTCPNSNQNSHSTGSTIGITAGVLLAVLGPAYFFGMDFLLFVRRSPLQENKSNNGEKDMEEVAENGEGAASEKDAGMGGGSGRGGEIECTCGWIRYEMEGAGRPPFMEPGLDHGALIRCEMSTGQMVGGGGNEGGDDDDEEGLGVVAPGSGLG